MERTDKDNKYIARGLNQFALSHIQICNNTMIRGRLRDAESSLNKVQECYQDMKEYQQAGVNITNGDLLSIEADIKELEKKLLEAKGLELK